MYNTVKELHIGLDILLQQVNSNRKKAIKTEEKDFYINTAILQFIKNRSNPKTNSKKEGFENTEKRYNDLDYLLRTSPVISARVNDSNSVYFPLPDDYFQHTSAQVNLSYDCNGVTPSVSSGNLQYWYIPFNVETVSSTATQRFYDNFSIDITSGGVTTNYTLGGNIGVKDATARFKIINRLIDVIRLNTDFEIFYELYLDVYKPNNIILVGNITNCQITYDRGATHIHFAGTQGSITATRILNTANMTSPTDLIQTDYDGIYNMLQNTFHNKNRQLRPFSIIERNKLIVFLGNTFIPTSLVLKYIKSPLNISYEYNQLCEDLPFDEILKITVRNIKKDIGDPTYKEEIIENQVIE